MKRAFAIVLFLLICGFVVEAAAIIGRPLTPLSGAGVARRTARRTTGRTMAYGYYGAAPIARTAVTGAYVAALPVGCTTVVTEGVTYRSCGGTLYRPYFNGTEVIYHVE